MNIVLFGIKGVGKTALGERLAKILARPFIDTDRWIEAIYRVHYNETLTCRQIYQKMGGFAFRCLEHAAIRSLEKNRRAVIAVGGGTFLFPKNIALLQKTSVLIHLTCDPNLLKKRLFSQKTLPPFIDPNRPHSSFDQVYAERDHHYRRLNTQTFDTTCLERLQLKSLF